MWTSAHQLINLLQAKSAAVEAFLALSKEDQTNLLESKAVKKKAKATASVLTKPTADAMPSTSKKTKKIKTPEEEAELAEKTKIKAEKEAEKEAKRIAKEEAVRLTWWLVSVSTDLS